MAIKIAILLLFTLTLIGAKPCEDSSQKKKVSETGTALPLELSIAAAKKTIELNIDDTDDKNNNGQILDTKKKASNSETEKNVKLDKRDLETAAGTNVLRPLFVYRQQIAFRQRVKKNNQRGN